VLQPVYWDTGTARLLPRLLKGRTRGPVFVTHRRPGPGKVVTPVMFSAVLQEGRWPPGPAWLFPPVEGMTWGVVPPGPRGAVGDADERSDYRPAERNARHLVGGRSA
jgi:hypothetical protein